MNARREQAAASSSLAAQEMTNATLPVIAALARRVNQDAPYLVIDGLNVPTGLLDTEHGEADLFDSVFQDVFRPIMEEMVRLGDSSWLDYVEWRGTHRVLNLQRVRSDLGSPDALRVGRTRSGEAKHAVDPATNTARIGRFGRSLCGREVRITLDAWSAVRQDPSGNCQRCRRLSTGVGA
jgi:hypothetical protein